MTNSARHSIVPVAVVVLAIIAIWYVAAIMLNLPWQQSVYARGDGAEVGSLQFLSDIYSQQRPVMPAPHQVAVEFYNSVFNANPSTPRSLVFHAWITLSATGLGFIFGTLLGIGLAVLIVHNRAMNRSLMPWIIASQTIPILAIAPMVVVVLNSVGLTGLIPKALISTYLSFFPVVVGMVKGEIISRCDVMRCGRHARRAQLRGTGAEFDEKKKAASMHDMVGTRVTR